MDIKEAIEAFCYSHRGKGHCTNHCLKNAFEAGAKWALEDMRKRQQERVNNKLSAGSPSQNEYHFLNSDFPKWVGSDLEECFKLVKKTRGTF